MKTRRDTRETLVLPYSITLNSKRIYFGIQFDNGFPLTIVVSESKEDFKQPGKGYHLLSIDDFGTICRHKGDFLKLKQLGMPLTTSGFLAVNHEEENDEY